MIDQNYTFTADGSLPETSLHQGRYSQLAIGADGAVDFGGGTLDIKKETLTGGFHTIVSVDATSYAALESKSIRLELPDASNIQVTLTGSTSPNLYVEHRIQSDN